MKQIKGKLNDFKIWDRELSEKEIWKLSGGKWLLQWWRIWLLNRYRSLQFKIEKL